MLLALQVAANVIEEAGTSPATMTARSGGWLRRAWTRGILASFHNLKDRAMVPPMFWAIPFSAMSFCFMAPEGKCQARSSNQPQYLNIPAGNTAPSRQK
jgi:hypothetical protein